MGGRQDGKSVLYTSHVLAEVEKIADRVVIMKEGKVVLSGNLDDIKSSYKLVVSKDELRGYLLKTTQKWRKDLSDEKRRDTRERSGGRCFVRGHL
ncbi:hypothetical protein [Thermotoga neapolitana]|uniref:hypothetical protein n=1 Tax=Thermotoga neapolitana TaxID=2337 RepID=UPI001E34382B|nr:hypothetical protein [Thermotoga neapolitana]